jgi:hypothetical protein
MSGRIMGIDLCDTGTGIAFSDTEKTFRFPTIICRDREKEEWFIGEDAYAHALNGEGVITDRLLKLSENHGTATIGGIKYDAETLLKIFLMKITEKCIAETGNTVPQETVVCIPSVTEEAVQKLRLFLDASGHAGNVHVISREESGICYCMDQPREIWNNQIGIFSLSDAVLTYYEMHVIKNRKEMIACAESENLEEAFNLEILSTQSGAKLADKILLSCAERILKRKPFSAVMLTGRGFEKYEWAPEFMKYVCSRRKVFQDTDLFARGACERGKDFLAGAAMPRFRCICDGRLDTGVTLDIEKDGKELNFPVANIGDAWYRSGCSMRLIPDNASELVMNIVPLEWKKDRILRIPLSFLPDRPPKTKRIDLHAYFKDGKTMVVEISDAGFGELFPKTDASVKKEVPLWE